MRGDQSMNKRRSFTCGLAQNRGRACPARADVASYAEAPLLRIPLLTYMSHVYILAIFRMVNTTEIVSSFRQEVRYPIGDAEDVQKKGVFGDHANFRVDFVERRNRVVACRPWRVRAGDRIQAFTIASRRWRVRWIVGDSVCVRSGDF